VSKGAVGAGLGIQIASSGEEEVVMQGFRVIFAAIPGMGNLETSLPYSYCR
jgi:hypothetical protein